jgi:hypothetical protein
MAGVSRYSRFPQLRFCIKSEFVRRLDMDPEIVEQIFDELFPTFQSLETQSAAIMQFLKDKGITGEDQLAPYLEQAANASSVRWRAARLRMARLLAADDNSEKVAKEPVASAREHAEKTAEKTEERSAVEDKAEKNKEATSKDQQGTEKDQVRTKNNPPQDSKATSRDEESKREPTNENLDSKNSGPVQAGAKPSESTKSTAQDAEGENKGSESDEPARKRA